MLVLHCRCVSSSASRPHAAELVLLCKGTALTWRPPPTTGVVRLLGSSNVTHLSLQSWLGMWCLLLLTLHHPPLNSPFTELSFPGGSEGKESACNAGDPALIPESGRSPGGGHGNPLQYSYLENPTDRGQCMGLQRDRQDWVNFIHSLFTLTELTSPLSSCLLPFGTLPEKQSSG